MATSLPFRCTGCGTEYADIGEYCYARCGRFGLILPSHHRPVEDLWTGETVVSAGDLIKEVRVSRLRPYDISVGNRFVCILYGNPGAGKTTMSMKVADAFQGNILYLPVEQGISDAFRLRLSSLEICRDGFFVAELADVSSIDRVIQERDIKMVFLDSLSKSTLSVPDLLALSRDRDVSVMATVQVNKLGEPAGSMDPIHVADLVIQVENLEWRVKKTRFGGSRSGMVL